MNNKYFPFKCFNCKDRGHKSSECPKKKSVNEEVPNLKNSPNSSLPVSGNPPKKVDQAALNGKTAGSPASASSSGAASSLESSGKLNRYGIEPFSGKDFGSWCFRVKTVLEEYDVWEVLGSQPKPDKKWKSQDAKAKSIIVACVADSHLPYIILCETAKEMVDSMKANFESTGVVTQMLARKKLIQLRYNENEDLSRYLGKFKETVEELKNCGTILDISEVVCTLLISMPQTYEEVVRTLELSTEPLTVELAEKVLLEEERRRKRLKHPKETNQPLTHLRPKETRYFPPKTYGFSYKCFKCGEWGHRKPDCPNEKKKYSKKKPLKNAEAEEEPLNVVNLEKKVVKISKSSTRSSSNKVVNDDKNAECVMNGQSSDLQREVYLLSDHLESLRGSQVGNQSRKFSSFSFSKILDIESSTLTRPASVCMFVCLSVPAKCRNFGA